MEHILIDVVKLLREGVSPDEIAQHIEDSDEYLDATVPMDVEPGGFWWDCPACQCRNHEIMQVAIEQTAVLFDEDYEIERTLDVDWPVDVECSECECTFDLRLTEE